MKFKTAKKRNNGFTLVEMLAVTAIVVILLAVGMVAVVHYARWLRITELDNSAREIYLAAENRAVLLSAGGRLEAQVVQAGGDEVLTRQETVKGATPLAAGGTAGQSAKFRYIYHDGSNTDSEVLVELLPEGTIDPALRKGRFYVVYEIKADEENSEKPSLGSVTDVFYADGKGSSLDNVTDFETFYQQWRGASRKDRLDEKFGYYGGEGAENGTSNSLKPPVLKVINGEELRVELTYEVPITLPQGEERTPKVWLYYGEHREYRVDLGGYDVIEGEPVFGKCADKKEPNLLNGVVTHTCTWVLDTLKENEQFKNLKFYKKVGAIYQQTESPPSFGGDFTVEAWIQNKTVRSATVSDTGNSLFASRKEEGDGNGPTAYIENLRHLQNLDTAHSKVAGKAAAEQIGDIEQSTSELTYYKDYKFKPIENSELKSYCGSHEVEGANPVIHFIKGLKVTQESANEKNGAGLFATATGNSADNPWRFRNIRLINTSVEGHGAGMKTLPAGALVGKAENASFDGCWVYWEPDDQNSLDALLKNNDELLYQISGSNAGGLAGELNGGSITNCLAATLVEGTNLAGGLVGQTEGEVITVSTSYADCYLTAPTAGGLIGTAGGTTVEFTNVYAAGFIDGAGKGAAGLCNGNSIVTASNAYSAMRYENVAAGVIVPLASGVNAGDESHCYHLGYGGKSYEEMIKVEFLEAMNSGEAAGSFTWKQSDSHPYSLRMNLIAYPFPGLQDLPHYGDWNAEFVKPALAYFEKYETINANTGDKTVEYGFSTEGLDSLKKDVEVAGICTVPLDGYAVAIREKDLTDLNITPEKDDTGKITEFKIKIAFAYPDETGTMPSSLENPKDYTYNANDANSTGIYAVTHGGETYYLVPLPDEAINSKYAPEDFYQMIKFMITGGSETTYAYNPHFAKTAAPMPEGMTEEQIKASIANMGKQADAYVRTPRHLRALSEFEEYHHGGRYEGSGDNETWNGHVYTFHQELDLDYKTYTGYDWVLDGKNDPKKLIQDPIGRSGAPFNGVYDGGCHTIENVRFELKTADKNRQYAGLFGLSAGTLRNIVYLLDGESPLSVARDKGVSLHLGALAGGNNGTIFNCAVAGANLEGKVYGNATVYVGGLVGENAGAIQNSAAEARLLFTDSNNFSNAYAGGLVGRNNSGAGRISNSYSVGHVSAKVDTTSEARVCGFVGYNAGSIADSYAAVWLESSGAGVETYGFCGEKMGSQTGTYFLNNGNFEYDSDPYNASYAVRGETKAKEISYQELTGTASPLLSTGMASGGKALYDPNPDAGRDQDDDAIWPYPTPVKKNGTPVHYGQWPSRLKLGEMGVYYWEKLELPSGEQDQDGNELKREVYGVSMLAVNPAEETIIKRSTLSNARSDNGVVTDYGYGYYCMEDNAVDVSADGIFYTTDGKEGSKWDQQTSSDEGVNKKLAELMSGYKFYSYHSFVPNPNPNEAGNFVDKTTKAGLYATGATGSAPNGTVTLQQGEAAVVFEVNPHFADALSIRKKPEKYTVQGNEKEITTSPGANEKDDKGNPYNPYEVRAVGQLSAINWNSTNRNTKTVIDGSRNNKQFPYLSYGGQIRDYVWKQTHDIHGNNGIYTPIAEYYAHENNGGFGSLYGWFSGSFDGDDYVIENVNIQGQTSSVAGLFGVVFNGSLKNIVLYSSDGKGKITNKIDGTMDSSWYSMGTLAGIASARQGTAGYKGSAVENCSASGYTIEYKSYNRLDKGGNKTEGGSTIGGLLGSSDMALNKCAAVTNIKILKGDAASTFGNDNLRAGGLTGVCQNKITNSYAGGEIQVQSGVIVKWQNGIFLGGIIGGGYFRPLTVNGINITIGGGGTGGGQINLKNCYSYVELPDQNTEIYMTEDGKKVSANPTENEKKSLSTHIRALYAIGGPGDGSSNYTATNCYYLESKVMNNNREGLNTTTQYRTGWNDLPKKRLATDLDLDRDSVQVIARDEDGNIRRNNDNSFIEQRIPLTSDDVNKEFLLSHRPNDRNFTYHSLNNSLTITIDGTDYWCLYRDTASSCMPIFTIKGEGPAGNQSIWVTFRGWATGINGNRVTDLTTDPTTLPVSDWNSLMAVTYDQLKASGGSVLTRLNEGITDPNAKKFAPVTAKTDEGFDIPGKYSYSSAAKLKGLNYPFPTILTRESGTIQVHYGDWPLNGIERINGGEPIRLNLFSTDPATEILTLSDGVTAGGSWKEVKETPPEGEASIAEPTVTPKDDGTCELSVRGNRAGLTTVTVTYTEPDGTEYPLDITVHVTAVLRVAPRPSPVYVYPGSLTKVPLTLCDELGQELTLNDAQRQNLIIHVDQSRCGQCALLQGAQMRWDEEGGYYYLTLRAIEELGDAQETTDLLPVNVEYSYQGADYDDLSTLTIRMLEPPEPVLGEDGAVTLTFSQIDLDETDAAGNAIKADTVATKVTVGTVKDPETGKSDPLASAAVTGTDSVVTLKGYAPGAEVTLTLELATRRNGAEPTEQPTTHEVTMTVIIPEPEPGEAPPENPDPVPPEGGTTEPETKQAGNQEPARTAGAEPEETGEAELPEGPEPALTVEEKTDPVPEKDAGAGEDGTEQ